MCDRVLNQVLLLTYFNLFDILKALDSKVFSLRSSKKKNETQIYPKIKIKLRTNEARLKMQM